MKLKQGTKVSCYIDGTHVKEGAIAIYNGTFYFCQNMVKGAVIPRELRNKYEWSWNTSYERENENQLIRDYRIKILEQSKENKNGRFINLGKEFNFKQ